MKIENFEKEKCFKCPSYLDKDCCEAFLTQAYCKIQFLLDENSKLESDKAELLEALKDAINRFVKYEMDQDCDVPFEHRKAMLKYRELIQKMEGSK